MSACVDPFVVTDVVSGLLWSLAYVLMLRRGSVDRVSGVPLLAFAPAITWELIYGVVRPTRELPPFVVPLWLVLDTGIVLQYLRHREREGRRAWSRLRLLVTLAICFAIELSVIHDLDDRDGVWSGFAVNVIMSLAFVAMIRGRRDVRGQSIYIALLKMLGTLVTAPHAYALHGDQWSLRVFMAVSLLADLTYVALVARQCRAQGIRPWSRV